MIRIARLLIVAAISLWMVQTINHQYMKFGHLVKTLADSALHP